MSNLSALPAWERRNFEQGLAPKRVRLKAAAIIWDEHQKRLDKKMPPISGSTSKDAERLKEFYNALEDGPYYEKAAVKEWLEAKVHEVYNPEEHGEIKAFKKQQKIYLEHFEALSLKKKRETAGIEGINAADSLDLFD